jgi:hypothetical protein
VPARPVARTVAILLLTALPAARAHAQAAAPFPEVPLVEPSRQSHTLAYLSMVGGVGLVVASFTIADRANQTYAEYLASTDPVQINELYDRTVTLDRWASATLLGGEALMATGLYLRFLRRPPPAHLRVALLPGRCALALRF